MKLLDIILEDYKAAEIAEQENTTEQAAAIIYLSEMSECGEVEATEEPRPMYSNFIAETNGLNIYHDYGAGYYFAEVI